MVRREAIQDCISKQRKALVSGRDRGDQLAGWKELLQLLLSQASSGMMNRDVSDKHEHAQVPEMT